MTSGVAVLRGVTEEDWELWRDLRARVLSTDPDAFGSTLEREQRFEEDDWRRRLRGGRSFVAWVDGAPVAMGGWSDAEPEACSVVSMWVDPAHRGRGIGASVLDAVLRSVPAGADVRLWVADGNAARDLYTRAGFRATGEVAPLRPGSSATKSRMVWDGR